MKSKNSPECLLMEIVKLDPVQFLGVCKILSVDIYKHCDMKIENVEEIVEGGQAIGHANMELEPRDFEDLWSELCEKVWALNRTRRRNLGKLIYAATKKEK